MRRLHLDWESRSSVDLKKTGLHVYAEHPDTFLWLARYWFEDEACIKGWRYGEEFPTDVLAHVASGGTVVAHNAAFERWMWNIVLPRQLGQAVPRMTVEQQDCTMSRALAMGLPGGLELAARILNCAVQKDMSGSNVMKKMARPRKRHADGTFTWWDDAEHMRTLYDYCGDDIGAEHGVDASLPALSAADRAIWELDQHMNDRGIRLDVDLIRKAIAVVELEKGRLDKNMRLVTGGAVMKCSERGKLVAWLEDRGAVTPSLAKGAAEDVDLVLSELGDVVATRAVELYRSANKSSTAKLNTMLKTVCADQRSRGTMQCHGAFTGRWAGRLWQPQNLKRMDEDRDGAAVRAIVYALLAWPAELARDVIELIHGDVMDAMSLCIRSMVCAKDGYVLIGADYSNVEGRVIAWLAGATAKLEAFKEQDAGGPDMYKLSYAASFGVTVAEVTKLLRQIGKVQELALGYQGSVGAFMNMAAVYGIKPEDIAKVVLQVCTEEDKKLAEWAYGQPGVNTFGLEKDVWIGLKIVVNSWRNGPLNRDISQFWWDLQDAALEAVQDPGVIKNVGKTGKISYVSSGGFLWCRLPTGKVLAYSNPRIRTKTTTRVGRDGVEYDQVSYSVSYDGWDGERRRWGEIHLYGGLQANHVTQGTAAEIVKRGMRNLEAGRGLWAPKPFIAENAYECILSVHDEALSEVPEFVSEEVQEKAILEYERLMLDVGNEFEGLPLAAKGWSDRRYVK